MNTWACGPLEPGDERTLRWTVTAVVTGPFKINYRVAAGLNGKAKAVRGGRRLRSRGQLRRHGLRQAQPHASRPPTARRSSTSLASAGARSQPGQRSTGSRGYLGKRSSNLARSHMEKRLPRVLPHDALVATAVAEAGLHGMKRRPSTRAGTAPAVRALVHAGPPASIGGGLAPGLARGDERGHEVRALVRDRGRASDLEDAGFELHEGDVLDAASLRGAGEGVDVAYYLVHSMGRGGERGLRRARARGGHGLRPHGARRGRRARRVPRRARRAALGAPAQPRRDRAGARRRGAAAHLPPRRHGDRRAPASPTGCSGTWWSGCRR